MNVVGSDENGNKSSKFQYYKMNTFYFEKSFSLLLFYHKYQLIISMH